MRATRLVTHIVTAGLFITLAGCQEGTELLGETKQPCQESRRGIIVVVDSFRSDLLTPDRTPNMWKMAQKGTRFGQHHSVFPCTTINNAVAIATGSYSRTNSWWGEKLYMPTAVGQDAKGKVVDFKQLAEARDWGTVNALNQAYEGQLLTSATLFQTAQAAGLKTAVLGKPSATFMQDLDFPDYFIDANTAAPEQFALDLAAAGYTLPPNTNVLYPNVPIGPGTPYAKVDPIFMADGITSDPSDPGSLPSQTAMCEYFVQQFVDYILPVKRPDLSMVWISEPDASMHTYGVGSRQHLEALAVADGLVKKIWDKVVTLGWKESTVMLVVGDHGATTVAGDPEYFPLRAIEPGQNGGKSTIGAVSANGYSFSGQTMFIEPLRRAGFNAYNGAGCDLDPYVSGVTADGSFLYPILNTPGMCSNKAYNSPGYKLPTDPSALPSDAVILMELAGGDLLHVPSHDPVLVQSVVRFLQGRQEVDTIFVHSRYENIPGTLSMQEALLESANAPERDPDIVISYWTDGSKTVQGFPGIGYHNKPTQGYRGDHGALADQDVHVSGFAIGADIRRDWSDPVPTGNVDLAPTMAHLLHLDPSFSEHTDGRVMYEIIKRQKGGKSEREYAVTPGSIEPQTPATNLTVYLPTSPNNDQIDPEKTTFTERLNITTVTIGDKSYRYMDNSKGTRGR